MWSVTEWSDESSSDVWRSPSRWSDSVEVVARSSVRVCERAYGVVAGAGE